MTTYPLAALRERLQDAIAGERRSWHTVPIHTEDIAAVLSLLAAASPAIDPERLARALHDLFPAVQRDRWPFTTEQAAAAIIAAITADSTADREPS